MSEKDWEAAKHRERRMKVLLQHLAYEGLHAVKPNYEQFERTNVILLLYESPYKGALTL